MRAYFCNIKYLTLNEFDYLLMFLTNELIFEIIVHLRMKRGQMLELVLICQSLKFAMCRIK